MAGNDNFDLDEAATVLARTPPTLRAWLADLPEAFQYANEGEGTFSAWEVVGHLIWGEKADWMPRLRIILEHGEGRPFDPYDRFAQREDCAGKRIGEMLDEFAALRAANLAELSALELTGEQLGRRGVHPALGPVSARQLISSWVVHDLGHIAQAARVMAKYYRDDTGPWRGHLPVLDR